METGIPPRKTTAVAPGLRPEKVMEAAASTLTDATGRYCFRGLAYDEAYRVNEVLQTNWHNTTPISLDAWLEYGDNTEYNFNNYYEEAPRCGDGIVNQTSEQCDDGNQNNEDNCRNNCTPPGGGGPYCGDGIVNQTSEQCDDANSNNNDSCKNDCTTPGGGGGGGGQVFLQIMEIDAECIDEHSAIINWRTNKSVTSWVVYGKDSDDLSDATSTETTSVNTLHSTTIGGLATGTLYSFTATASEGSQTVTKTVTYSTDACVDVKGEEGKPILSITKNIPDEKEFYNPGDKGIKYVIKYANTGNLTAFNVIIRDVLPAGLVYADTASSTREWSVGDLAPGATGEISYLVNVTKTAAEKIYVNTATIEADNYPKLEALADNEVRTVEVLAETGFSLFELTALVMMVGGLVGASSLMRRLARNS